MYRYSTIVNLMVGNTRLQEFLAAIRVDKPDSLGIGDFGDKMMILESTKFCSLGISVRNRDIESLGDDSMRLHNQSEKSIKYRICLL
ncbi:hypothetical protein AVEN_104685-1 [Araneus ventricosus]|uniref:Uncharacterized protein n=1 Tax=Araneus ventricosus TaxID=182803 RepID=A0A4Y2BCI1_ARAVE|nr:hypothetical protein AVEN_104685-1 [Araneus ventricosus]